MSWQKVKVLTAEQHTPKERLEEVGTLYFPQQLKLWGLWAKIGSGLVRGGPEVRFHEG